MVTGTPVPSIWMFESIFPLPGLRLGDGHWYAGAVDLDVQNRNARSGHGGQFQLLGTADLLLLLCQDIPANGFRRTFYGFGRYRKVSQQFQLCAPTVERNLMPNEAHHPTGPRREFRALDIQFSIHGELAAVATQAQVARPLDLGGSQHRQHLLGPQLYVLRLLPTDRSEEHTS